MIDAIDTFAHHFSVSHSSSVCEKEREREGGDIECKRGREVRVEKKKKGSLFFFSIVKREREGLKRFDLNRSSYINIIHI